MEYFEELKTIVAQYLPDDVGADQIKADSHFMETLNINSANLVDVVLDVEDAFDIMLENEDMEGMQTMADAMAIIAKKLEEKQV